MKRPDIILKRCPFGCSPIDSNGDDAVVLICERDVQLDYNTGFGVRCNECGIEMWEDSVTDVAVRWNRRRPRKKPGRR